MKKYYKFAARTSNAKIDFFLMIGDKRFFIWLFGISLFICLVAYGLALSSILPMHPHFWGILAYNALLAVASHYMMKQATRKEATPFEFNNYFMGNSGIRLLLSAVVILLYFYLVKVELILFTGTFFFCYFAFAIFEIRYLLANLRQNSKRLGKTDGKQT